MNMEEKHAAQIEFLKKHGFTHEQAQAIAVIALETIAQTLSFAAEFMKKDSK